MNENIPNEEIDFLDQLINRALNFPNTEFELLTCYDAYLGGIQVKAGLKSLIKMFKKVNKNLKKLLRCSLKAGITEKDLNEFKSSINVTLSCINYYKTELTVLKNQLQEFRVYMRSGNFLKMLFGDERPEEEMVDYRTLPFSLF